MSAKICCACKKKLPENSFGFRDKVAGERHTKCKACSRAYAREHYYKTHPEQIDRARKKNRLYRTVQKLAVIEFKKQPCRDCEKVYPWYVMEFDHRNPETKTIDVGSAKHIPNPRRFFEELAKCDVVCANCHRARTYNRRVRLDRTEPTEDDIKQLAETGQPTAQPGKGTGNEPQNFTSRRSTAGRARAMPDLRGESLHNRRGRLLPGRPHG